MLVLGWLIVAALLVYPLSSVVRASFIDNDTGAWTIANYATVLTRPVYQRALGNTFVGGFGGMLGSLILGVTLAYLVTRMRIRGRALVSTLAVIALVTPPFIGAYAWIVLFGANGVIRNGLATIGIDIPPIYGAVGVIVVFSLKFFPHVFLLTSAALGAINPSLEEAAEGLGLSPRQRFFRVTLRLILPSISAAALLTFVLSIADFGTPRIIGRGFQMLSTEAFILFASEMGGNPGLASSMSILLILISLIFVLLQRYVARHDVAQGFRAGRPSPRQSGPAALAIGHIVSYAIVLAGALPTFVVVLFSFRRTSGPVFQPGLSLQSYARVMATVPQAVGNSLLFAAAAVALIVVVGTATGYVIVRRAGIAASGFDAVLMVPYIVPGVVMGIAFTETFNSGPVVMTGTGTDHRPGDLHSSATVRDARDDRLDAATQPEPGTGGGEPRIASRTGISQGYGADRASGDHRRRHDEFRYGNERVVIVAGALCRAHRDDAGGDLSAGHRRRIRHGICAVVDPARRDGHPRLRRVPHHRE